MRIKLALLFLVVSISVLFTPNLVRAQTAADAFAQYTNPHAICDYYRAQAGYVVERISDNECLVSLGTGKYKTFTQYYYSSNNWCYKLIQESKTVYSNCVPRPDKSVEFTKEEFTKFAPYIIGVVVLVVILAVVSNAKPPVSPAQPPSENTPDFRRRQAVRSKKPIPNKRARIWRELGRKK